MKGLRNQSFFSCFFGVKRYSIAAINKNNQKVKLMVKTAFSAIVAGLDLNGGIGVNNTLLAKIPEDLKHFRDLTLDSTVVMGKNTYASLPKGALDRRKKHCNYF